MKRQLFSFFTCLFTILICQIAAAQNGQDSVWKQKAIAGVRAQFMQQMAASSYLYNGKAYEHYWYGVTGHPFFLTEQFNKGNIYYNGNLYEEVPLLYDVFRDELVSKSFLKNTNLSLVREKISYFTIGTHTFVRLNKDTSNTQVQNSGFYEILYTGMITVLEKREYKIEQSGKAEENISRFREYDHYYIEKDGIYHSIESEGDLQTVLWDQGAEIRKFLNKRDIRFKKDPGGTIVKTVIYYAALKK